MPAIHLVRHGQASFGSDDYDLLSPLGEQQVLVSAAEVLRRGARTPVIASGTLTRQVRTAELIAETFGIDADMIDAGWNEVDAHGLVEARLGSHEAMRALDTVQFQEVLDVAFLEFLDGPQWPAFRDACMGALHALIASVPKGSDGIAATSSGVIAAIVATLTHGGAQGFVRLNRVSFNASITTIIAGSHGLSLLTFNEHAHLTARPGLLTNR